MPQHIRNYAEFTAKNSLRHSLVLGVQLEGLLAITFGASIIQVVSRHSRYGSALTIGSAVVGYAGLRLFEAASKPGAFDRVVFKFEKKLMANSMVTSRFNPSTHSTQIPRGLRVLPILPPDLLSESDLITDSESLRAEISAMAETERLLYRFKVDSSGSTLGRETLAEPNGAELVSTLQSISKNGLQIFSLAKLPVQTHPLWIFDKIKNLALNGFQVWVVVRGTSQSVIKRKLERSQRNNFQGVTQLASIARNLDAHVSHKECETLIEGLSQGNEKIVELSLIIIAPKGSTEAKKLPLLDPEFFLLEKDTALPIFSALGFRKRLYQSHFVRATTASDLIPKHFDPKEVAPAPLSSRRGLPVYFNPLDSRLDALHWLVVGATGSGKSFFVGTLLKRLLATSTSNVAANCSVLFVDHHRSFKRFVRNEAGPYLEPQDASEVLVATELVLKHLAEPGMVSGIELSDLLSGQKKTATTLILGEIEAFLKNRKSNHVIYVVLDECWNFMRDEPLMVQRAFREFRKLRGAAIAITQSLSDFLKDEAGQSILQNAPIRVILRQGEDVTRYQEALLLNEVELQAVRYLQKTNGEFSECVIKTPYYSRLARLYPTHDEHELLRTDRLRGNQND